MVPYAISQTGGTYIKPKLYNTFKIVDHDGNILTGQPQGESRQVIKESTAFNRPDAMVDVCYLRVTGRQSVNFSACPLQEKQVPDLRLTRDGLWYYRLYYTCGTTWTGYDNNARLSGQNGWKEPYETYGGARQPLPARLHENLEKQGL